MVEATNWSAINNVTAFMNIPNDNAGGFFYTGILYLIVVVILFGMLNFGIEVASLISLFIGIILGILLLYLGLVPGWVVGGFVGLEFFLILYLMFTSPKNQ